MRKTEIQTMIKKVAGIIMLCLMLMPDTVYAAENYQVQTKNTVVDAADAHVIVQDTAGKYGLIDQDGEEVIACEYDNMSFPEDTEEYDYVIVQKGDKQGILDYEGKELVAVRYDSITPYVDGNTVAAGRDGVWTYLYDEKGKEAGRLEGQYEVVSDYFFKSDADLKNDKDKQIFTFAENNLLSPDDGNGEDAGKAHCLKIGKYIAADYYVPAGAEDKESAGDMSISHYVKIFDRDGSGYADVKPEESWADDDEQSENMTAAVSLDDVISDHSLKVRVQISGEKDSYRIYDMEKATYSEKYRDIGTFIDGKAFALDKNKDLQIIDESGKAINDESLNIDDYSRKYDESGDKAYILFKKKGKNTDWKLFSLKTGQALPETYEEVIFKDHQYVIVGNEDGKYGVMNRDGNMVIPFGEYGKEILEVGFYSDNCVCITDTSTSNKIVHFYESVLEGEESTFHVPIVVLIAIIVAVILVITLVVLLMRRTHRRKEEERLEQERREQARQEAERRKRQNQQNRRPIYGRENVRIIHSDRADYDLGKSGSRQMRPEPLSTGIIRGLRGDYAGREIPIRPGHKIRIGRSHGDNDLVVSSIKASRRHCIVTYSEDQKGYFVKDLSSNGVYLAQGTRLPKNVDVPLPAGTVIFLGNEQLSFELK